jgi:hypothetical protein
MRGKSFSQEVRNAVEMYLDVPVENEAELRGSGGLPGAYERAFDTNRFP